MMFCGGRICLPRNKDHKLTAGHVSCNASMWCIPCLNCNARHTRATQLSCSHSPVQPNSCLCKLENEKVQLVPELQLSTWQAVA